MSGTNLVADGGFDRDELAAWDNPMGTVTWQREDAAGCASSGSVLVVSDSDSNNQARRFARCFLVTPGRTYNFGGWVRERIEGWQSHISVAWMNDCNGYNIGFESLATSAGKATTWHHVEGTGKPPEGSQAAEIRVYVFGNGNALQVDAVYLTPAPGGF